MNFFFQKVFSLKLYKSIFKNWNFFSLFLSLSHKKKNSITKMANKYFYLAIFLSMWKNTFSIASMHINFFRKCNFSILERISNVSIPIFPSLSFLTGSGNNYLSECVSRYFSFLVPLFENSRRSFFYFFKKKEYKNSYCFVYNILSRRFFSKIYKWFKKSKKTPPDNFAKWNQNISFIFLN